MGGLFAPTSTSNYEVPSAGVTPAVCADVIDLGVLPGWEGKPTHKIDIVFQVAETDTKGRRFQVSRRFSFSLHEKSTLRSFIESWRGKRFRQDELDKFDFLKLIGAPALLLIVHNEGKKGGTFANADKALPLPKDTQPLAVTDYVRRTQKVVPGDSGAGSVGKDDDLPF